MVEVLASFSGIKHDQKIRTDYIQVKMVNVSLTVIKMQPFTNKIKGYNKYILHSTFCFALHSTFYTLQPQVILTKIN